MMRGAAFALLLLLALGARPAAAQTCTLTDTNMNFGTYTGALLNGTSTGKITCSGSWNVSLNAGAGAGATETVRKMTGPGGAELSYQVFQDAARTINWGNTTGTEPTGTGNANITFYSQIPAGQYVVPGTYTDTLSTGTTNFTVTAVVAKDCTVTATNLAFGTYTGAQVRSTSTITATCTSSTTYTVGLNAGTATGATVTNRSMTGPGSALLHYSLFNNSGYTTNWGNSSATNWVAGTGNGSAQPLTVYGQIPAGQYATPGSYADTITVSVTY
jgi:spore coat protein U-like protein